MPEVHVRLRWPDGAVQRMYSPSLVVTERFDEGSAHPVEDFVPRMGEALAEASERVRAAYGFPCSRAAASWQRVQAHAAASGTGDVVVEPSSGSSSAASVDSRRRRSGLPAGRQHALTAGRATAECRRCGRRKLSQFTRGRAAAAGAWW